MNTYKIPAPYSGKSKKYFKIELQAYKYNKKSMRSDRIGKMFTYRIDEHDLYLKVVEAIENCLRSQDEKST